MVGRRPTRLPPWGSDKPRLGNNPLVIAVPRAEGHVVLDMAMSQFSFGVLEKYGKSGDPLPVDGGYDSEGNLTRDAAAIEETGRVLPIGFWKGSGLSLALDIIAAGLSGGLATHQIPADPALETGISQVFIAIASELGDTTDRIIEDLHSVEGDVRYPGERTLQIRKENMKKGIPVDEEVWRNVCFLAGE
jgi:3-dehydro-L-gulonate 2-dehydrogenase